MNTIRKMIFAFFVAAGLALAVSAQKPDDQKKPPKNPPTVDPGNKTKPRENPPPREDKKPKKPGMEFALVTERRESNLA